MRAFMRLPRRDLLMAVVAAPLPTAAQPDRPTVRDILQERIEVGRQSVGMVAVTLQDGRREVATYGRAGTPDDRPLDADSVFEIGSITKVFTALLLADMVQRREVALDDPVVSLFPAGTRLPEKGKPFTLLDLATYTSGLPRMPGNFHPQDSRNPYADYTAAMMMEFLASYVMEHEPGTHYEYANLGFALLGQALATRAGRPYEALVIERICAPLGLDDTRITLTPSMKARRVQAHDATLFATPDWEFQVFAGAGALHSTANDLCRFVEAAMGLRDTPLNEAFALLLSTRRPAYKPAPDVALGWFVASGKVDEIVWKDGATGGTCSFIGWGRRSRRGGVVLSNAGYWNITDIGQHLIVPDLPVKPQRHAVPIDAARLERLVGRYRFERFVIAVTRLGDRLFAQLGDQPAFEVFAVSDTEFFYRVVDARLTFELGADGQPSALVLHQDNQDRRGVRL
jgi:CubicO group peptidase (beta-lactamase class C family)